MTQKDFRQLKPGTRVRIVDKRTDYMDPCGGMDHWLGKIMTVRKLIFVDNGYNVKMVEDIDEFEGDGWYWDAEMIAHEVAANTQYDISINICGNKISATYGEKTGIARCSSKDNFNELKGILIAVARMCGYELHSENCTEYLEYCLFGKTFFDDKKPESTYELLPWKEAIKAIAGDSCYKNNTIWSLDKKTWEEIRIACTIVKSNYGEKFEVTDRYGCIWMIPACCVRKTGDN